MSNLGEHSAGSSVEIGGITCTVRKMPPFFDWIRKKYGSLEEFKKLKPNQKDKIFLRWKWGSENDNANESAEATRKMLLKTIKDALPDKMTEFSRWYWDKQREWEERCSGIKDTIGLRTYKSEVHTDPQVASVQEIFKGDLV